MKLMDLITAISILLVFGCEVNPYINFGFNAEIDKNGTGLVIADIDRVTEKIALTGTVTVSEGSVKVWLTDPDDTEIYSATVAAGEAIFIDELFTAKSGYWKLRYESYEGVGSIDLHINY